MAAERTVARTVALGGGRFAIRAGGDAAFWEAVGRGGWEAETFRFIRAECGPDSVFVDIGAWIGLMALAAARTGAAVLAFEPDPVAFAALEANLAANGVAAAVARNEAVDAVAGRIRLHAPAGFGQSVSATLAPGAAAAGAVEIAAIAAPAIAALLPPGRRVVLKIDIEGHEYRIGPALAALAAETRAVVHLSLHPQAVWAERRARLGSFPARIAAFRATAALLAGFRSHAFFREDGRPAGWPALLGQIVRPRYTRNFSLVGRPRG